MTGNGTSIVERVKKTVESIVGRELPYTWDHLFSGGNLNGAKVPVGALVAELERQKATKKDYIISTRTADMKAAELLFPVAAPEDVAGVKWQRITPTPWCHKQIADRMGIPQKYYERMRADAVPLLDNNVTTWLHQMPQEKRMVRTLDGKARAFLSDRYRCLDNVDLAFKAFEVFQAKGAEVVSAELSENRFYLRAINPSCVEDISTKEGIMDHIVGGVAIGNSETGEGALNIEVFGLRLKCMNGMIGQEVFSKVHLGEAQAIGVLMPDTVQAKTTAIWLEARDMITHALDNLTLKDWAVALRKAKEVPLTAGPAELAQGSWGGIGMTEDDKSAVLKHLFGDGEGQTQFGMAQAITATAREVLNPDHKAEMERLGFRMGTDAKAFQEAVAVMTTPSKRAREGGQ